MGDSRMVCKQLDYLSLRILELMQEQIQNNNNLERIMKYGFIDIAKSRYIMGNRNLSKLQLPGESSNEFTALKTVNLTPAKDDDPAKFTLHTIAKTSASEAKKTEDLPGVRKRIPEESDTTAVTAGESIKVVDPLKWFGLLVPQNLRKAQSSFASAVDLATQGANIQLELETSQNKYKELCLQKLCSKSEEVPNCTASKKKSKKNRTQKPNKPNDENSAPHPEINSPTKGED